MSRLTKIEIANYRAFYENQTVPIAIPNGKPGSGLTVVLGPNNSGKSTVLDALLLLEGRKKIAKEERHGSDPIVILLTDENGRTTKVSNGDGGSQLSVEGESVFNHEAIEFVPSRRHWSPRLGNEIAFDQFRNASYSSGRPDGMDSNLSPLLGGINRNAKQKAALNALMRRMLPTFNDWVVETDSSGDFIEYTTRGGAKHQTNRFGDGLVSLFRLVAHLVQGDKGRLLVVDEPELSLHPQAQKALATLLSEQSAERQILIATHSPHFVQWDDLEGGAQVVRVRKKGDIKSEAFSVPGAAPYKDKLLAMEDDWHKPQLLDAVAKELFFADNVVFVEGQEDVALLRRFIKSEKMPVNFEFFGYGSGGAGNIPALLAMARDLGLASAALYDGDMTAEAGQSRASFPEALIEVLPTDDIRDKHRQEAKDGKCRETADVQKAGVFTRSGEVKGGHADALRAIIGRFVAHFDKPVA